MRKALEPDYLVEYELGAGGMGVVFVAVEKALERRVAVKVLRPEMATAEAATRFSREAKLMARLRHPNVVTIYRPGEKDGLYWFTMDLIQGETLARRLERGPMSSSETLRLARDLLNALGAAHGRDIIHRDVKPSNIFLDDGHAMLADFGIARSLADTTSDATRTQQTLGTPAYMAPEQRAGEPVSPATDLYSVGAVLYECLTGRRWPQMLVPDSGDWSGVPRYLVPTLQRALALAPTDRLDNAQAFANGLSRPRVRRQWMVLVVVLPVVVAAILTSMRRHSQLSVTSSEFGAAALPAQPAALQTWSTAESLYFGGNWRPAHQAYRRSVELDSTCLACDLRLLDIDRWLERRSDSTRLVRLIAGINHFDPSWQATIRAINSPARARLTQLEGLVKNDWEFWPAWYYLGEELFNRGPLLGRARRDALDALGIVSKMKPDFAAIWLDLTLARIAEGDSAGAASGLNQLLQQPKVDGLAQAQRFLAQLAFAFRFTGEGARQWENVGQDQRLYALPETPAGPRLLTGLGSPRGAVALGQAFERLPYSPLRRSGLIAQLVGLTALGRPSEAGDVGDRMRSAFPTVESEGMARTFGAANIMFDPGVTRAEVTVAMSQLEPLTRATRPTSIRNEARWLMAMGALRRRDRTTATQLASLLTADSASAAATLVQALLIAESDGAEGAVLLTEPLVSDLGEWDRTQTSPLLRTALKLSRGEWYGRMTVPDRVRAELRWHQHFHLPDYPVGDPVGTDGDWAFSTLASWIEARLLDSGTKDADVCEGYQMVAERWGDGEPRYQARADTARARLAALHCEGNP